MIIWGVVDIRKMAPIRVIVHSPRTEEGRAELARRVADVHANAVMQRIKELECPDQQKMDLLDAVIRTVRERSAEK